MTNDQFAARVGCSFTYASRLRNGSRMPSAPMLAKIIAAFPEVPSLESELVAAAGVGAEAVGKVLRGRVFFADAA